MVSTRREARAHWTFAASPMSLCCVCAFVTVAWRSCRKQSATALPPFATAFGVLLMVGWETRGNFGYEDDLMDIMKSWQSLFVQWPRYLVYALLFAALYGYLRQRHDHAAAMQQLEADRSSIERRLTE